MSQRYNPPPNWPAPPAGWEPPRGWQPDPAWGPAPDGWQLFIPDPSQPKKRSRRKIWLSVAAVVLLLGFIGSLGDDEEDNVATVASSTTESQSADDEAKAAEEAAEKQRAADELAAEEARKAEEERLEEERQAAEQAAAEAEAVAAMDPANYQAVSDRDFALVAKDPDAHAGKKLIIYGYVMQLDSATGPDAFLASAAGARHDEWYEYDQNVAVTAPDASILAPVVEDDIVKMFVEVVDSFSYDTQIGGNTTVPRVTVNMIEVIGSTA